MSGGSYDYLCWKDADSIGQMQSQLQNMADRLSKMGYADDAARETMETLLEIRQAHNRIQTRIDRLNLIWQSVEWCDSGDSGEDGIKNALALYRGEIKKP